jgi:hypothetical protein
MSQVSPVLRRGEGRYFHWCPGCKEMHQLPDRWTFDGNLEKPTFQPSFKHTSRRYRGGYSPDGLGLGERYDFICHYILTAGILNFCADSMHELAGQAVPLPALPAAEEPAP